MPELILRTTLPETLRKLRNLRGMSQAELSRRSGVARSTIAGIETGQSKDIMLRTLAQLCGALAVTFDYATGISANGNNGKFASEAPDATRQMSVREARTCQHCGRRIRPGELHLPGECIMIADRKGGSTPAHRAFLAAATGFGVASIEAICADENGRLTDGRLLRLLGL